MNGLRGWFHGPVHKFLIHLERVIVMNNAELLARLSSVDDALEAIATEVSKVSGESNSLLTEVQELKDQLAAAGGTTPEVDAAIAAVEARAGTLAASVSALDDQVPDPQAPIAA
jgi:chromosome segregation ATPase